MRDAALLAMLVGVCALALSRPWLGVLGLALFGAMHPQSYGEWMAQFPVYKVLFLVTCVSVVLDYARTRRRPPFFWDWRLVVLGLLFADFVLTTYFALLPDTARGKLIAVGMLVPPLLLTLWLTDSREKLRYLIIVTAAGIALVAVKGGYWAVMTGFADRVYGPPGSQIGGNNEFSVALAMTIPLLVLWLRETADRRLRWGIGCAIALCYVASLTSWSRGGLVSLAAMSAFLVWDSRHKFLATVLFAAGVAVAVAKLPEQWIARMETIPSYQADQSFQGRQETWRQGLAYLQDDPWTGSGFDGWRAITAEFKTSGDLSSRAWHNAYIEALVEHGIPGFVLWGTLLAGTMIGLTRMIGRGRRAGEPWLIDHGAMLRAALVAYAAGGLTLGIAYWELMFQLLGYSWIALRLSATAPRGAGAAGSVPARSLSSFFTLLRPRKPPRYLTS
jgi:probable O-glycosylation ligase (exosortase A-associated)